MTDSAGLHPLVIERQAGITKSVCGCYYCLAQFAGAEIVDWVDDGRTAICPRCGIDSVVSRYEGFSVALRALEEMNQRSFHGMRPPRTQP
jgi:hypothetical protein